MKAQKAVTVFYEEIQLYVGAEEGDEDRTDRAARPARMRHRDAKRKQQDDGGGGGGKKAKGRRLAAEAAAVTRGREQHVAVRPKEDRRVQTTFPHLSTPGHPTATTTPSGSPRMRGGNIEGWRREKNTEKLVDEEMDEDGPDMCHILKLVAMAIFRSAAVRSWGRNHRGEAQARC